jgi:predicted metal-dependent enzyme (double-stranded beta helix superfamily)
VGSFDVDEFVARCRDAVEGETEPWLAVRDVLDEALRDRAAIVRALPPTRSELVLLYVGPDVTVVKVVWAPQMVFPPHDHLTWACNGLYSGCEQNTLFEPDESGLRRTGEFFIDDGGIGMLDADSIHSVRNPDARRLSAALHVYGGDFPSLPRSNWIGEPPRRVPADIAVTQRLFAEANDRLLASDDWE